MDRGRAWLVILGIAAIAVAAAVVGRPARASTPVSAPAGEGVAPLAWTTPAREVSATEAELFGRFNPRGPRTVLRFEYGRTKAYGHYAPPYVERRILRGTEPGIRRNRRMSPASDEVPLPDRCQEQVRDDLRQRSDLQDARSSRPGIPRRMWPPSLSDNLLSESGSASGCAFSAVAS